MEEKNWICYESFHAYRLQQAQTDNLWWSITASHSQATTDSLPAISPLQKKISSKEDVWDSPKRKTAMMGQVQLLLEMHLIVTQ